MKHLFSIFFLTLVLIINSCTVKYLDPKEADRSMKILNGNIMNILSSGSEKPEYKAISFLLSQTSSPLPIVKKTNSTLPDTAVYNFPEKKGVYYWNKDSKSFMKQVKSDIVSLRFPIDNSEKNEVCFDLRKFKSQSYSSRPDFPTQIDAVIKIYENEIASIQHNANITNNLPENITTKIIGTDYKAELKLKRTQIEKDGKLFIDIYLKSRGAEVIAGNMEAQIEYNRRSYFFKIIEFNLKLMDHHVQGKINYSAIDPTSADYIGSFNSNSSIQLYEGKNEVGQIILSKTENGDLLDYFIRFSNGEEILLSNYIPILNKLLNLKY